MNWTGTRDLKNLSLVEFAEVPTQLYGDAIACGFYANELLVKLLHCDDAMPILFHAYKKLLQMLSSQEKQLAALRYFEKTLLKELGYAINLQQDIENELPIEPENYYQYIPQKGFRKNFSPNDYDFLGAHLIALHQETLADEKSLQAAKRLMRMALKELLGEKEIRSRELF